MPLNYHSFYIYYRQLKKQLRIGGIELDTLGRNVYIDDNQAELTTKEYFAIGDNNLLVTTSFASTALVHTTSA